MKVSKKIFLAFALVLAICLPTVLMTACGKPNTSNAVDVQKGVLYYDEQDFLYIVFSDTSLTMFVGWGDQTPTIPEDPMFNYQTEKSHDTKGNIIYTFEIPGYDDDVTTYTIFDITKTSFKMSVSSTDSEFFFTLYNA